jgi:hypothetical protein
MAMDRVQVTSCLFTSFHSWYWVPVYFGVNHVTGLSAEVMKHGAPAFGATYVMTFYLDQTISKPNAMEGVLTSHLNILHIPIR